MKTKLFKYQGKDDLKTFHEMREEYSERVGAELPIPDDEMGRIIILNLVRNCGNIVLIEDAILDWCNDFSEYNEADRYLSRQERDESVKNIYSDIVYHLNGKEFDYFEQIKRLLPKDNESNGNDYWQDNGRVLCKNKEFADEMAEYLKQKGYEVVVGKHKPNDEPKHYWFVDVKEQEGK